MLKSIRNLVYVASMVLLVATCALVAKPISAAGEPALSGGADVAGLVGEAVAINDVVITGTGNPTVPVRLFVTHGTLSLGTTTGLTFSGASSGASISFSGSLSNVNAALATLTYTRNSIGTDTLEITLVEVGEVFFEGTGNLYEYVSSTLTWYGARDAAAARTKYGATGYLTTITSAEENNYVADRLENAGWMGASDSNSEGYWIWAVGPEAGTQFWLGDANGSQTLGRYSNWSTGEPNDSGGNEDCGQFLAGGTGKWNDLPCTPTTLPGYVVEYGTPENPPEISSLNISVVTQVAPDLPTSLGSANLINGSWGGDNTPTLQFNLYDDEVSEELQYQIQIDDSANFGSPLVDYTSGFKSQGSFNFFVGQAEGEGTSGEGSYTFGSEGQTLTDGQYYWRVKAIDAAGHESAYAIANSGSVAFKIDVSAPTVPGQPSATSPTNDRTPVFSWAASVDEGSGLLASAYVMQWSQDPEFGGFVTTSNVGTSYTIPSDLSEGTWYFRVRARDAVLNYSDYSQNGTVVIDVTNPAIESLSPANGGTDVQRNQNLEITFNESIVRGNGNLILYKASDDSIVATYSINSENIDIIDAKLTIDLAVTLEYSTEYYIQIASTALDDQAGNSFAGVSDAATWNFTTEGTDLDSDGIVSEVEDAGPNGGDANSDGTLDSQQAHVASFENWISKKYVALEVNDACDITDIQIISESEENDADFQYPEGLFDFTLYCGTPGFQADITQYYYGVENDSFMLRKFMEATGEYISISNASIYEQEFESDFALIAQYAVTDGSTWDDDGNENGIIEDPAGVASAEETDEALAKSGANMYIYTASIGLVVLFSVSALLRKKVLKMIK